MDKVGLLKEVEQEMIQNRGLPLREANLVFGEGDVNCSVMFIGEAPGFHENEAKRPFVGRGGQLLRRLIRELGWLEQDVYITNIVKRRPPENRDPSPEEIEAYRPYLARQIEIINPKIVVPLGRFSMNYFLPEAKITRDQGRAFKINHRLIVPMFHPAAALRSTGVLDQLRASFLRLPRIIGGEVFDANVLVSSREVKPATPKQDQVSLF
ncbi:MAG: DNA polymerase bacteriophage-type [Parcubacteria group bacterium Gr01-1014_20]|nr:MAG: DNA polymerase bacteriophage-type [Parcubacteria group bacterium Gr01-1014_20]